jgi:hypothetical protein
VSDRLCSPGSGEVAIVLWGFAALGSHGITGYYLPWCWCVLSKDGLRRSVALLADEARESLSAIASESMMTAVFLMYGAVISRLGCFSVGGADGRQAERSSRVETSTDLTLP